MNSSNGPAGNDIQSRLALSEWKIAAINALASEKDWMLKCKALSAILRKYVWFDYAVIGFEDIRNTVRSYGFISAGDELKPVTMDDFEAHHNLATARYIALRAALLSEEDGILNGEDFSLAMHRHVIHQLRARQFGVRSCLLTTVPTAGDHCFTLRFYHREPDYYRPDHWESLKQLTSNIGITLDKMMALEELAEKKAMLEEREKERSQLLSISQAVATIRDKNQLFKVVIDKIQPTIGFEQGAHIFVLDPSKQSIGLFLSHVPREIKADPGYENFIAERFSIKGSPFEEILKEDKIHLLDPREWAVRYPHYRGFDIMNRMGIRQSMITLLRFGGEVIGTFHLFSSTDNFFPPEGFPLFQSIADQLAVAVSNILANDELERRAKQIELLNKQLELQKNYLIEEVQETYKFEDIVGTGESLKNIFDDVNLVARTDSTVLILGETGTGKELIARAIHNLSRRRNKPLVKINCAALPAQLIESELFGHERGAFTGAIDRRIGKFEIAAGSTLLLDEIGELPVDLQAKLLRALQEKEIERLGSNKVIKTDVRVIAATNRNLAAEVKALRFRSDLFYRINGFPITLPPLRERKEDIPVLASHFIAKSCKKLGKSILGISPGVLKEMMAFDWPGNIRELEYVIDRACIICKSKVIQDLYWPAQKHEPAAAPPVFPIRTMEEMERDYILYVLKQCKGKVRGPGAAADVLGLPPTTLASKMLRLGIKKEHLAG